MEKSLKLLKAKYNLSDEFIKEFIRNEIQRQAVQDLNGLLKNASVTKLESLLVESNDISKGTDNGPNTTDTAADKGTSESNVSIGIQRRGNLRKAKSKSK